MPTTSSVVHNHLPNTCEPQQAEEGVCKGSGSQESLVGCQTWGSAKCLWFLIHLFPFLWLLPIPQPHPPP